MSTINTRMFEQALIANLIDGVNLYTERMVPRMKRKAPVSKDRSVASPRATYLVRPRSMNPGAIERYVPKSKSDRERQQELLDVASKERRRRKDGSVYYRQIGPRLSETVSAKEDPGRFVFAAGPHKDQIPDVILTSKRGALHGYRRHRSGTLRDSIHSVPAVLEGTTIVGGVAADAPYAKPIEFGFIHHSHGKSGRRVKAQPFFRPIWKDNQAAGAARLARYVKRVGR